MASDQSIDLLYRYSFITTGKSDGICHVMFSILIINPHKIKKGRIQVYRFSSEQKHQPKNPVFFDIFPRFHPAPQPLQNNIYFQIFIFTILFQFVLLNTLWYWVTLLRFQTHFSRKKA